MSSKQEHEQYLYDSLSKSVWERIRKVAGGSLEGKIRLDFIGVDLIGGAVLAIADAFKHRTGAEETSGYKKPFADRDPALSSEEVVFSMLEELSDENMQKIRLGQVEAMVAHLNKNVPGLKLNIVNNRANRFEQSGLTVGGFETGDQDSDEIREQKFKLERGDNYSLYVELTPAQARTLMVIHAKVDDKKAKELDRIQTIFQPHESDAISGLLAGLKEEIKSGSDQQSLKKRATRWILKELGMYLEERNLVASPSARTDMDGLMDAYRSGVSQETRGEIETAVGRFIDSIVVGQNDEHSEAKTVEHIIDICNRELETRVEQKTRGKGLQ